MRNNKMISQVNRRGLSSYRMWPPGSVLPLIEIGAPGLLASSSRELNIVSITASGSSFRSSGWRPCNTSSRDLRPRWQMSGWLVSVSLIMSNTALSPSPTTLGSEDLPVSESEFSLSVSDPSCQAAAAAT